MSTVANVTRLPACATALVALLVLVVWGIAACSPTPANSAKSPTIPPTASPASPSVTPNPRALEPNDCTAPPPSSGTQVHSPVLAATVTLPSGWAENPANEGKNGLQATFALETGKQPNGAIVSADPFPSPMTPHDAVAWEISQPGAGTVVAKGDCTIAGSPAAFFESTVQMSLFPGITWVGDGYSLYMAHRGALVSVSIDLPSSNGSATPLPRASAMTDVKSILGSWTWDQP